MFAADLNRRGKRRHPYFQPVQIRYGEDGVETLEAHSRNISPNGIGLFHIGAPQEEQAILTVSKSAFESIQLRAKLAWSEECKAGCYISGWEFIPLQFGELPNLHV